jgi:hypothetical protein
LRTIGHRVGRTTFFDDDDFDISTKTLGFPKEMDSEERTGRSTADDGNTVVVLEGR